MVQPPAHLWDGSNQREKAFVVWKEASLLEWKDIWRYELPITIYILGLQVVIWITAAGVMCGANQSSHCWSKVKWLRFAVSPEKSTNRTESELAHLRPTMNGVWSRGWNQALQENTRNFCLSSSTIMPVRYHCRSFIYVELVLFSYVKQETSDATYSQKDTTAISELAGPKAFPARSRCSAKSAFISMLAVHKISEQLSFFLLVINPKSNKA